MLTLLNLNTIFFVLLQIARDIVSGDADTTRDDRDLETYQTSSQGRKLIV